MTYEKNIYSAYQMASRCQLPFGSKALHKK